MVPTMTITCADCGTSYETKRANAKVCSKCRLLRDLLYMKSRSAKCMVCEHSFAPTTRNEVICPNCDVYFNENHLIDCAICSKNDRAVRQGVNVCVHCAHDPAIRGKFIAALMKGKAAREQEARAYTS